MTWYAIGPAPSAEFLQIAKTGSDWYHGSGQEFSRFDLSKNRYATDAQERRKHWNSYLGAHFTSEASTAHNLADGGWAHSPGSMGGYVYHCSLETKNPKHYPSEFDMDRDAARWARQNGHHLGETYGDPGTALTYHHKATEIAAGFKAHLQAQGHDSITYGNEMEGTPRHPCAIVFHPDQIKIDRVHSTHDSGSYLDVPFCPECGKAHEPDTAVCDECGQDLREEDESLVHASSLMQHFANKPQTGPWTQYDDLDPDTKASIDTYMGGGEPSPDNWLSHKRRYEYQTEHVPVEEFKRRVMQHGDVHEDWGDDFERYHHWYTTGFPMPDHGTSRWPAIENSPDMMGEGGYLEDGWHRSHSYVRAGDSHIPVVRVRGRGKTGSRGVSLIEKFAAAEPKTGPVYYHGYGRADRIHIDPEWDNIGLFVSHDPRVAVEYARGGNPPKVDRIEMAPDTKVKRHEGLLGLPVWKDAANKARDEGYDVAEFHYPHDFVGHIILNRDKIASRTPEPDPIKRFGKTANKPNWKTRPDGTPYRMPQSYRLGESGTLHTPAEGEHAIYRGLYLGDHDTDPATVLHHVRERGHAIMMHRGNPEVIERNGTMAEYGFHWTTDPSTAYNFAFDHTNGRYRPARNPDDRLNPKPVTGAVLEMHTSQEPKDSSGDYGYESEVEAPLRRHVTKAWLHVHRYEPGVTAPHPFRPDTEPEGEVPFHRQNTHVATYEIPLDSIHHSLKREAGLSEHGEANRAFPGDHPKPVYLRFGDWPKDERSTNFVMGWKEHGVSVYDLDKHGEPLDPDSGFTRGLHHHNEWECGEPDEDGEHYCGKTEGEYDPDSEQGNDTRDEMLGRKRKAEQAFHNGVWDFTPYRAHLVTGDLAGVGHDDEPLLTNVKRVGDWIQHRHLFIPTAERHHLALPEDSEDNAERKQYIEHDHEHDLDHSALPQAQHTALLRHFAEHDWRGRHQAPRRDDSPGYRCSFDDPSDMMPDVHEHPEYYSHDRGIVDYQSHSALMRAKGKPESMVTIYRAAPHGVKTIHKGDWVTQSEEYAKGHALAEGCPGCGKPMQILKGRAKAKDLFNEGYMAEWGYDGEEDLKPTNRPRLWCSNPHKVGGEVEHLSDGTVGHRCKGCGEEIGIPEQTGQDWRSPEWHERLNQKVREHIEGAPKTNGLGQTQAALTPRQAAKARKQAEVDPHLREILDRRKPSTSVSDILDLLGPSPKQEPTGPDQDAHVMEYHKHQYQTEQDERPGFNPGDDLSEMHPHAEWVPIEVAQRFREHGGNEGKSRSEWEDIESDLRAGKGMHDPMMLVHHSGHAEHSESGPMSPPRASLGEGNHRLNAAERAGWTHVPMRVVRMTGYEAKTRKGRLVPLGWHRPEVNITPSMGKPSEVFHPRALDKPIGQPDPERLPKESTHVREEEGQAGAAAPGLDLGRRASRRPGLDRPEGDGRDHLPPRRRAVLRRAAAADDGLRPVTFHEKFAKDRKSLEKTDRSLKKNLDATIDGLRRRDPNVLAQTHTLKDNLKGYFSTKVTRGHRLIHQTREDDTLHILGLIDHDDYINMGNRARNASLVRLAFYGETDWDRHYDSLPHEVHRGLFAPESADAFKAPTSDEEVAHMLIDAHQREQFGEYDHHYHEKFGTHWTSSLDSAKAFAREHLDGYRSGEYEGRGHYDPEGEHYEATPVVFHAERPHRHEIETDPRRLDWQNIYGHDESDEKEIPIRHGAQVRITGVSWRTHENHPLGGGEVWHRHDLARPVTLRAEDQDSPEDETQWNSGNPHQAAARKPRKPRERDAYDMLDDPQHGDRVHVYRDTDGHEYDAETEMWHKLTYDGRKRPGSVQTPEAMRAAAYATNRVDTVGRYDDMRVKTQDRRAKERDRWLKSTHARLDGQFLQGHVGVHAAEGDWEHITPTELHPQVSRASDPIHPAAKVLYRQALEAGDRPMILARHAEGHTAEIAQDPESGEHPDTEHVRQFLNSAHRALQAAQGSRISPEEPVHFRAARTYGDDNSWAHVQVMEGVSQRQPGLTRSAAHDMSRVVHVHPSLVRANLPATGAGLTHTPTKHFQDNHASNWSAPGRGAITDSEHPSAGVLLHELGHVDHARRQYDSADPAFEPAGRALHTKRQGLSSGYADTNWHEGYAESFAHYHGSRWASKNPESASTLAWSRMHQQTANRYAQHYNWPGAWDQED